MEIITKSTGCTHGKIYAPCVQPCNLPLHKYATATGCTNAKKVAYRLQGRLPRITPYTHKRNRNRLQRKTNIYKKKYSLSLSIYYRARA